MVVKEVQRRLFYVYLYVFPIIALVSCLPLLDSPSDLARSLHP